MRDSVKREEREEEKFLVVSASCQYPSSFLFILSDFPTGINVLKLQDYII